MQNYQVVDIHKWLRGYTVDVDGETCTETIGNGRSIILPLIDLRSIGNFNTRHLHPIRAQTFTPAAAADASIKVDDNDDDNVVNGDQCITVVNLPLSSLLSGERSCELPPRNLDFAILIPCDYAETFLNESQHGGGKYYDGDGDGEKNHCPIHKLFFATHSEATMQSRKPWRVRQVLIETDDLWKEAGDIQGLVVERCGEDGEDGVKVFRCLPRVWKPDPLISSFILPYLKKWVMCYRNEHDATDVDGINEDYVNNISHREKTIGLVWDLGSGSGRDICFLAEEIKEFRVRCTDTNNSTPLHFIGVDNHKGSAARCTPLWNNRGVEDITESICLDLNKLNLVRDYLVDPTKVLHLPSQKAAWHATVVCIYSIRYLNRKLLSYIANARTIDEESVVMSGSDMSQSTTSETYSTPPLQLILPLGTVIAISHFCKPHEGASWTFDHPKESSVLDRWELKHLFSGQSTADCEHKHECGAQRWEILYDDLNVDGDHGRTLIQFVAKKIA